MFGERTRQYRSLTCGKRLVTVVDNARCGAEVEPLLPASGASLVIVTSHGPLYDLQAGAVVELPLDPLAEADALELLERVTSDARLAAEPDVTRELPAVPPSGTDAAPAGGQAHGRAAREGHADGGAGLGRGLPGPERRRRPALPAARCVP
ncbi:hypothetical protein [Streptomyces dysideae]|uniref:Uncharacterized protein n=1 Tax=Streptomyces dysideae TaxID=909626 RepID=A0A101UXD1_9ACTN|nr:hypothetical protein [Streptomyces dysideae]KUO18608.1 hypothetical protein AQJ91_24385 [Streptomyces dysideae]